MLSALKGDPDFVSDVEGHLVALVPVAVPVPTAAE
jgi:hypothetical protein